ncbi:hypothetical protein SFRURICE_002265 [Spodoptera frugiperda]|uniref:Mediator of RNA polymerase II transcription subunit 13 n=1 Tax=Spodoptera frugiperda TaxID=7108 RepID=A0A2H1WGX2_SPOFR|nr:hypothetical protein SFRURICE_002265 [Spodoptera frugiperda]
MKVKTYNDVEKHRSAKDGQCPTELYGIKWRKLVWGETNGGGDGEEGGAPLADPVISSYARCLAGDILCVWRRVPAPPPPDNIYEMSTPVPPPLSLRAAKELWIFWYGEEPDLNGLVAPELIASREYLFISLVSKLFGLFNEKSKFGNQ